MKPAQTRFQRRVYLGFILTLLLPCHLLTAQVETAPVGYVNPLIGTAPGTTISAQRHSTADTEPKGQTVPFVGVPFAMTHWTPQTRATEQKCIAPYYYDDGAFQGFRGSHWMSGSCTQDYGSVTLMPMRETLQTSPEEWASAYSHDTEISTPAYYRVQLEEYDITAEVTGTVRAGLLRFAYRDSGAAHIVVQPNSDEREGFVEIYPKQQTIVGYNPVHRIYQGWGQPAGFDGYFVVIFDTPFEAYGTWKGDALQSESTSVRGAGDSPVGAYARFRLAEYDTLRVMVGTSFTSFRQALDNLDSELEGWDFTPVREQAEQAWNDALSSISVQGGTDDQKEIFYTALYHSMLLPRQVSDASGTYPGFAQDTLIHVAAGFTYYEDFSLWDTYRAVHPLLTILEPDRVSDMMRSLIAKAGMGDWLPIFPCWNNYTAAMIGDHAVSPIVGAYLKGITDFDTVTAYEYMLKNATRLPTYQEYVDGKGRRALNSYMRYGYIPLEDSVKEAFHQQEQVSRTLEYAYDDFVIAQLARELGEDDDYAMLLERARNYRNVFDTTTGFVRGRHADSSWVTPFNPAESQPYITEGTPWQYTWYVPQDVQGLIDLMGGREQFIAKLDQVFQQGHYWHGNEPSHQIAYLYDYAGAPWKTQQRVRTIMQEEYSAGPGGLSGNDDTGQMSAWYVFSALGFYPVCPGLPYYALGAPLFEEVTLSLENGKQFTIRAKNVSQTNLYIQSATLNGEPFERPWIRHQEIAAGGTLTFRMGPNPNEAWGSDPALAPPSLSNE
ncbi:MAG TPA: GH92 family glycosyl hydrolase [bacterium]|nr:GH92 family glycosyl hydrolase [bacterium]